MAEHQQALANAISADPDVESLSSFIGVDGSNVTLNSGRFLINLKPHAERKSSASEIIRRLQQETADIAGISLFMQPVQDLSIDTAVSATQYQFTLENQDLATLQTWTPKVLGAPRQGRRNRRRRERPAAERPLGDRRYRPRDRGALRRHAGDDRQRALRRLRPAHHLDHLHPVEPISRHSRHRSGDDALADVAGLDLSAVSASTTGQVPLSAISTLEVKQSPLQISHLKQFPVTTISFNLAPGASLGGAVDAINAALADIDLPASFAVSFQGAAQAFQSSLSNEVFLLLAAVATMYIVLGVLYESFIHPITILSTLPSAGIGALLALDIAGAGLDIIGVIGIVLLIGIVKKNAIMMIDFALDAQRNEGQDAREAIYQACLLAPAPDPDDDGGGDVRRAAADAGNRRRLGAAPSARPRDRRRPRRQPGADAVHDAGDLSLLRAHRRRASAPARRTASLAAEAP